jgi:hypothetical protein
MAKRERTPGSSFYAFYINKLQRDNRSKCHMQRVETPKRYHRKKNPGELGLTTNF